MNREDGPGGRSRPLAPIRNALGWLTGRTRPGNGPRWRRWTVRISLAALLSYLLLVGPLVRLLPAAPGFRRLQHGRDTVFYTPDLEGRALEAAVDVREAQHAIMDFWGESPADGFPFGIDLYLCGSHARYWNLIINHAPASASLDDVFLDMSFPWYERGPFLRHELAHVWLWNRLGGLPGRLRAPAWLDEGIATILQDSPWQTEERLRGWLLTRPELASLATTPNILRWLSALHPDGGAALAQYTYVHLFTADLIAHHGRARVLAYLREAARTGDHDALFVRTFGTSLAQMERAWIAEKTANGVLPAGTRLVDRGLGPAVVSKFLLAALVALALAAWLFRQLCRLVRLFL